MMKPTTEHNRQGGPQFRQLFKPPGSEFWLGGGHSSGFAGMVILLYGLLARKLANLIAFMELNNDEIRRYSRHLILPEVGLSGQKKICSTSYATKTTRVWRLSFSRPIYRLILSTAYARSGRPTSISACTIPTTSS